MQKLRISLSAFRPDRGAVSGSAFRQILPPLLADRVVEGLDIPDCAAILVLAEGEMSRTGTISQVVAACVELLKLFDPAKLTVMREAGVSLQLVFTLRPTAGRVTLELPALFASQMARLELPGVFLCDVG